MPFSRSHLYQRAYLYLLPFVFSVALAMAACQFGARFALAQQETGVHEGVAGPYRLGIEVVPKVPLAGKVQFRVRPVLDPSGAPVTDARIEVYLGREGREEIKTLALNSPADRTAYVGNAEVDRTGDWSVRVDVASDAGRGEFAFVMQVRPRARSGRGLVAPTLVYLGAAVVVLGGIGWLVRSSRRARRSLK
ncbi:MAG: hypothetical protein HYY34_02690 [Chloroflexi bacterium]|nr:hypothetical protein [Chloroflexota bacterium]